MTGKKKDAFCVSSLLGYPDSNQERQDQNLQCYHYTIAQYFAQKRCKDTAFLRNTNFLAHFLCLFVLKQSADYCNNLFWMQNLNAV